MINLQNRLDDIQCYEPIRELRWPDGVRCRHCGAAMITKPDRCAGCHRRLDDLAGTVWGAIINRCVFGFYVGIS